MSQRQTLDGYRTQSLGGTRLIAVSGTNFRFSMRRRLARRRCATTAAATPAGSTVNDILTNYPDVYLYGCLVEAAVFTQGEAEARALPAALQRLRRGVERADPAHHGLERAGDPRARGDDAMNDFLTGRPLDPHYRALEPRPDAEYGSILPFAYNAPGSPTWVLEGDDFRPALPGFARSTMKGFLDLLQGTETGKLTPEALETITLGSPAPAVCWRRAARWRPARQGWRWIRPVAWRALAASASTSDRPLYHGTSVPDFPAFGTVSPWKRFGEESLRYLDGRGPRRCQ